MKKNVIHTLKITPSFGALLSRFPIVILTLILFTGSWVFKDFFPDDNQLLRLQVGLVIGAYLCVMQTMIAESRDRKPHLLLQIIVVLITSALAWFSETLRINMFMAVGAVLLALGNSIQWRMPKNNQRVWDFTHQIWTGAVFAVAGSLIFGLGLMGIMAALSSLFDVDIKRLAEYILLPIGFGLLAPLYWLGFVPRLDENPVATLEEPTFISKAIAFMGSWLLAPLTLIYALILMTYAVKIGLTMTLPKGEIAALTVPFLIIGTLTWLLLEPPFIRENRFAKLFRTIWFPISIPVSILLAISVAIRISEYGITPQRLALIGCFIWALGIGLYSTAKGQSKADIRLIPGFAAVLLTVGALTSEWFSLSSQSARFESQLRAANIMQSDGQISLDTKIKTEAARRAKGAAQYLLRHDGQENMAKILNVSVSDVKNTEAFMSSIRLLNVSEKTRFNIKASVKFERGNDAINVRNFDYISNELTYWNVSKNSRALYSVNDLKFVDAEGLITISDKLGTLKVFDFETWLTELKEPDDGFPDKVAPMKLYDSEGRKIVLVLNSATRLFPIGEDDVVRHSEVNFHILTSGFE